MRLERVRLSRPFGSASLGARESAGFCPNHEGEVGARAAASAVAVVACEFDPAEVDGVHPHDFWLFGQNSCVS